MNQAQNSAGAGNVSMRAYAAGFALSIILTLIPFLLVMNGALSRTALVACILACAVAQLFVQLHYFLHLDASSAMYWNVVSLVFTFFIIFLFVGGSIWIMHSLHYRM